MIDNNGKPLPSSGTAAGTPRVFVLSPFRLLRDGVVQALEQQASVVLVGAGDLSTPAQEIARLRPDVLLLDIALPGSLDASRAAREAMPSAKIVALGAADVEPVLMECARAGVSGFVPPGGSIGDVISAVHSAMRGELVCSPRTAGLLLSHVSALAARPPHDQGKDALTQREKEIAKLVSEGLSNKQIAIALGIQSPTVKNHVHSILGKLNMQRRIEIAAQSGRSHYEPLKTIQLLRLRPNGGAAVHDSPRPGPDPLA
ncbi:LuxR C-terminal-related transcriptional regulator [Reyranella sp.]|uniref:LuxR C-terminal-related transcriptional regulator n=1 Tax=Reyranella sp. TaxID=1929291 RepID=UPI003BAD0B5C